MSTVQSRIRELLRVNKVTQKSLAAASGYTITAINQMLLGNIKPNIKHIEALKYLCPDMDVEYVLFGETPKQNDSKNSNSDLPLG